MQSLGKGKTRRSIRRWSTNFRDLSSMVEQPAFNRLTKVRFPSGPTSYGEQIGQGAETDWKSVRVSEMASASGAVLSANLLRCGLPLSQRCFEHRPRRLDSYRLIHPTEVVHYRRPKLGSLLGECSIPELLQRPDVPISTAPERELSPSNPIGKFDAGQCNGRAPI